MACSPSGAGGLSEPLHGSLPTPRSYIRLLAMSVQLRINGLQARRPSVKGTARRLVRLSDIPESPTVTGPVCEALELDGRPCQVALAATTKDPWCNRHYHEWKEINSKWSKAHYKLSLVPESTESMEPRQYMLQLRGLYDYLQAPDAETVR